MCAMLSVTCKPGFGRSIAIGLGKRESADSGSKLKAAALGWRWDSLGHIHPQEPWVQSDYPTFLAGRGVDGTDDRIVAPWRVPDRRVLGDENDVIIEVDLVNGKVVDWDDFQKKLIIAVTIAILCQHRYTCSSMLGRSRLSSDTSTPKRLYLLTVSVLS